jgi:hypothetical protein
LLAAPRRDFNSTNTMSTLPTEGTSLAIIAANSRLAWSRARCDLFLHVMFEPVDQSATRPA